MKWVVARAFPRSVGRAVVYWRNIRTAVEVLVSAAVPFRLRRWASNSVRTHARVRRNGRVEAAEARLNLVPVPTSTNVVAAGYDDSTKALTVTFHNDRSYRYSGVPKDLYDQLTNGQVGPWRRVGRQIRQYPFTRL